MLSPLVLCSLPLSVTLTCDDPAVGAAAALGFSVAREGVCAYSEVAAGVEAAQHAAQTTVEVEVENCEVLGQSIATEQEIVLVKGDVRVRISRDLRGGLKVCAEGEGRSREELREIGEQVVGKVTQMYVYNKVMTELKNKGFTVVNEGVAEDETVHIHVRQQVV